MIPGIPPRSPFTITSSLTRATSTEVRLSIVNIVLALACAALLYFVVGAPGRSPEARTEEVKTLQVEHDTLQHRVAELRDLTVRVQSATKTSQEFATGNFLGRTNAF